MDLGSHRLANNLVGNSADAATLEATLIGPELRMEQDSVVAIAGADLDASLDSAPLPMHTAVRARAGSVLRFGQRRSGGRAYVAFAGGIAAPLFLGSAATHTRSAMGGFEGRAVRAGDRLLLGAPKSQRPLVTDTRVARPTVAGGARLRVLAGPQEDFFPSSAFEMLLATRFLVSSDSDRMGYRLIAPRPVPRIEDREMISDAAFTGGIQVPVSGQPIMLMADRPTTGGYPQIAIVITADLPRAGQLVPGDWVEFQLASMHEAIAALAAQRNGSAGPPRQR
jgi:antagonist of KipI